MSAIAISDEIADALKRGAPVVALETTIVSHGMPWPDNLQVAMEVEDTVRAAGALPAAIAVVDGAIRVGVSRATLTRLAKAEGVLKLSSADLAYGIVSGRSGATTVAATMIAAKHAGIRVFATGGIGGVHRGAETTFDISADLTELARTDVVVVAAGAKAILDLPKTLETLETLGVPVICYRSDEFPAFWSRRSGLKAPIRLDDVASIGAFVRTRAELALPGGVLVANPISPNDEIATEEIQPAIETAVAEAADRHITAKEVTPFLLDAILRETGGQSLLSNAALVKANARLAAEIAIELAKP